MKEGNVICYESRKSKYHKKNYATYDLELTAIVHALKSWRNNVMGMKFELITDHVSLKYLFEKPNLNVRQARWLEFLCEFDFDIKHVKGKENKVVDALNRKFHVDSISIRQIDLRERVLEVVASDEFYLQEIEELQKSPMCQKFKEYRLVESNVLF